MGDGKVIFGADSRLDRDGFTVSVAADADFPASNLNDDRAFTKYKMGSAATELLIKTDAGVGNQAAIDYLMIAGHDFADPDNDGNGPLTVEFQESDDDGAGDPYTAVPFNALDPTAFGGKILLVRSFAVISKRFFRLRLTRGTSFKTSIGQLQWGGAVRPGLGMTVGFDPQQERIGGQFNLSRSGNIIGAVRTHTMRIARVRLPLVSAAFNSAFRVFWDDHASKLKPFLMWWNDKDFAPGFFERDAFFGIIDPAASIARPLRTQLDVGLVDMSFTVIGLKE